MQCGSFFTLPMGKAPIPPWYGMVCSRTPEPLYQKAGPRSKTKKQSYPCTYTVPRTDQPTARLTETGRQGSS